MYGWRSMKRIEGFNAAEAHIQLVRTVAVRVLRLHHVVHEPLWYRIRGFERSGNGMIPEVLLIGAHRHRRRAAATAGVGNGRKMRRTLVGEFLRGDARKWSVWVTRCKELWNSRIGPRPKTRKKWSALPQGRANRAR